MRSGGRGFAVFEMGAVDLVRGEAGIVTESAEALLCVTVWLQ
jgi:hypothetical protein